MKKLGGTLAQLATLVVAAAAILRGCDCSGDQLSPPGDWVCMEQGGRPESDDEGCPGGGRYVLGACAPARCDIDEDGNGTPDHPCCPGTVCTGGGACEVPPSRFAECTQDSECGNGLICLPPPWDVAGTTVCAYPRPGGSGCPMGSELFNDRCVVSSVPPCSGGCAAGLVCNIDAITPVEGEPQGGRCETPPAGASSSCSQTCGVAQILVYRDPDNMLFNTCCAVTCECAPLPNLSPGNWGRFSDLVLDANTLLVSAYDGTYGDLVLGVHSRISGRVPDFQYLQYVDGVPVGDPVVANPNGPRGGQATPGPNVGKYTSIALQNGDPRIAYYDVDEANLRYAVYNGALALWSTMLVDDGRDTTGTDTGDVGRYTSLVIDANGIAHVSYYGHRREVGGRRVTGPMYARATRSDPTTYDDWERVPIEVVASCDDTCDVGAGEVCALEGGQPTCFAPRADCASCACDEACVDLAGVARCRPSLPLSLVESTTVVGFPEGRGLFTSLVLFDGAAHVVYYDRQLGQLRGAVANFAFDAPATSFTALPVACAPADDSGQHVSLAVAPDALSLAVAYQAQNGETLYFKRAGDLVSLAQTAGELVDAGIRTSQVDPVGGSASLAFDAQSGEPYIAYANLDENDLLFAYQRAGQWTQTILLDDGAYGSFAKVVIDQGIAYVSNYLLERDEFNRDLSRLVVHMVDLATLP